MLLGGSVHTERYDIFEIFLICQNIGFNMRRAVSRLFGNRQKDRLVSTCQEHQRGVTGPKGPGEFRERLANALSLTLQKIKLLTCRFLSEGARSSSHQPSPAQPSPVQVRQARPAPSSDRTHRTVENAKGLVCFRRRTGTYPITYTEEDEEPWE